MLRLPTYLKDRLAFLLVRKVGTSVWPENVRTFWLYCRDLEWHDFQRLELLGDRVFSLHFLEFLMRDHSLDEGQLSKRLAYVNSLEFHSVALSVILDTDLSEVRKSHSDLLEVMIAIIYLHAPHRVGLFMYPILNLYSYTYNEMRFNSKGYLQEYLAKRGTSALYITISGKGKARFNVGVYFYLNDLRYFVLGTGTTIKKAQQEAAYKAIQNIYAHHVFPDTEYLLYLPEGFDHRMYRPVPVVRKYCRPMPWPYLKVRLRGREVMVTSILEVRSMLGVGYVTSRSPLLALQRK